MRQNFSRAATAGIFSLVLLLCLGTAAFARAEKTPSQTTMAELVTITGEVASIDPVTRRVVVLGPLGGEIAGRIDKDVKNLDQVHKGDLVTIAYYQSIALSATKQGESNPLFTGGDATTSRPGEKPGAYASAQTKSTVTVDSVDADHHSVVFQGEDGTLFPVDVERPEFIQKLRTLRAGDKIDVVTTEAVITAVSPAKEGDKPSATYQAATLIVDRGTVMRRVGNTLFIRNERNRIVKVNVDPKFKFLLDGKEVTVSDIDAGTRLERTAFRIVESASFEKE
ncbi:MAG: hypothetical protein AB7P46_13590 [Thermoanaerobaculia bacterium]